MLSDFLAQDESHHNKILGGVTIQPAHVSAGYIIQSSWFDTLMIFLTVTRIPFLFLPGITIPKDVLLLVLV